MKQFKNWLLKKALNANFSLCVEGKLLDMLEKLLAQFLIIDLGKLCMENGTNGNLILLCV